MKLDAWDQFCIHFLLSATTMTLITFVIVVAWHGFIGAICKKYQ